ncbi:DNA polymerase lambda [Phytophthora citrophthora]|uniref:DNA-directed DNA polymerase n=1 Tax=Phytophthora citrophthora TaxID=4793 RepID=A0AAD9H1K0_9STRA|nr:DNA polymerase lambda [Phytophthora citrophthora]
MILGDEMELLSAQQKREFFEELEELLRSSRRRRLKLSSIGATLISQTTGTRHQETAPTSVIVEKERSPILGQQQTAELPAPTPIEMRDLKKLGALQKEKRPPERKSKGSPAKKAKTTTPVDPKTLLLTGKCVLLVPFGPDMGRKRLEILQSLVEKLGGTVVQSLLKTNTRAGVGSGAATIVKWSEVSLVIVSGQLTREKAAEFLHIDKFPPANIEVYTPEWLVFLRQEKKVPPAGLILTWAEQQDIHEEAAQHEQHCEKVAQQLEEKRAKKSKGDESDDEGSDQENSGTRGIVRAPPVQIEDIREQQADLNENNRKLVEERTPIFYKNNPGFRPINETAVPDSKKIKGDGFICQRSSAVQQNLNAHLTDPLEEMMEFLDVERDVWRQYMYKKVVSSLKATRRRVCSVKDFKDMHWVKGRLRDKVVEILETGRLAKLDAKKSNPRLRALVEIARIWGVGPVTAAKLYGQGYKSVADLRKPEAVSALTTQQQIGVKLYEDFLTKIPRAEVHQIEKTVVDEVHKMIPNAIALACGSYRRGKLSSGDCDVLVTDPDADTCDILPKLLKRLHESGFLTDDLTHFQKQKTGGCDTYMGVCHVSKDLPFRRLDIKIYPRHFFGFAMLYFTGSDHFNRSMRLYANKNGWSLSDRALTRVMRVNGTKVRLGESVICESEVDVFIALGLEYKDPTERNCFDIKFIEEDEAKAKRNSIHADGASE